jgi:hypothetical protein
MSGRADELASRLGWSIVGLALIASIVGLFSVGQAETFEFRTVRGETVELYGGGIYRYDSVFQAGANQGTDLLTLLVPVPLLVLTLLATRRGSLRARLLRLGTFVYFLYLYASLALHTAYNGLFLVYVLLFAASLLAVMLDFVALARRDLTASLRPGLPRRAPAWFMIGSGLVTLLIWSMGPVADLLGGPAPELGVAQTLFTNALDIAVIVPAALIAGRLILEENPIGYVVAFALLVLEVLLAPMIALQTAFQIAAGESFTAAQVIGPISGFVLLALIALAVVVGLLRHIEDRTPQLANAPTSSGARVA